jgi:hypothetical protein
MAAVEIQLRVAHAHEILESMRQALAVAEFVSEPGFRKNFKRAKKNASKHPPTPKTRAMTALQRANAVANMWKQAYNECWLALQRLNPSADELRGLRILRDSDVKTLGEWMHQDRPGHRYDYSHLPWIWRVAIEKNPNETREHVVDTIQDWREEGPCNIPSSCIV